MSLDYLPKPKGEDFFSEKSTSANPDDIASQSGGTYISPGNNNSDIPFKDDLTFSSKTNVQPTKQLFYFPLLQSRFSEELKQVIAARQYEQSKLTTTQRFLGSTKKAVSTHPFLVMGLTASFVTIAMGVRATFRGNMDRSMRLLDVRTGLAFVTFTALVVYQYRMRREQKHELLDLKRKILMELGEESMET